MVFAGRKSLKTKPVFVSVQSIFALIALYRSRFGFLLSLEFLRTILVMLGLGLFDME